MDSASPRIEGLDPERIAELASRYIREGEAASRTDQATAAFTQATAFAAMATLHEVHKLRLAVEAIQAKQT